MAWIKLPAVGAALGVLLAALLLALFLTDAARAAEPGLAVRTRQGLIVGVREGDLRVFRGIPYAAAPVGDLRWRPPQPAPAWAGARAADAFGAPCAQFDVTRMAQVRRYSGEGIDVFFNAPMSPRASEDCLTANVWAPAGARKAPVVVYFYGGGGSADMQVFNGAGFARSGVVFVNFNYRNLTMGKFAHPAITAANPDGEPLSRYDVMDQLALLRWVRANAAAFGGDPGNVTIAGVSAGGAAVLQLLTVPSAKGLFHRAAVQSGVGWWVAASQAQNEALGAWLVREAGLPADITAPQLRALPPDALPQIGHFAYDGRLVPFDPTQAFAKGRVIDVPLLIGWNSNDGSSLRMNPDAFLAGVPGAVRATYGDTPDLARAIYTDSHVAAPARWIAHRTERGAPTYLYYFSHVRAAQRAASRGAAHGSEIPYVMNHPLPAGADHEERRVTNLVHSCWVSFARTGRPACDGAPEWPRYARATDRVMELNAMPAVRAGLHRARLDAQEAAIGENLAGQKAELDRLTAGAR